MSDDAKSVLNVATFLKTAVMAPNDLIQQQPQPPQQRQSNEVSIQQPGPSSQAENTTTAIVQAL